MQRALLMTGLALAAASAMPAQASAQATRVTLAPLEGRGSGPARRALGRALERRGYTVTMADSDPGDDVAASAALVAAAGTQALVGGTATGRRQRWRFHLWIRDHLGGAQGEVSLRVANPAGIRRLSARLDDALQGVPTSASPDAETPDEPAAPEPAVDDGGADPPGRVPEIVPAVVEPRSEDPPQTTEAALLRASVLIGAGVRTRRVELLSPDGVDAGYLVEPYFEVTAQAELHLMEVVFARVRFGSSAGLVSDREDPALQPVDSLFTWLRGDLGAAYWVDDVVALGAAFGVGWDRYELTFNELVPTIEYVHVRPAVMTGVRLVGRYLVVDAEAGVRVPFGVGDLEALHGVRHSVIGADGLIRLRGGSDLGFSWAAELGARRYWLTFERPDGEVTGTDGGWHATGYVGWEF